MVRNLVLKVSAKPTTATPAMSTNAHSGLTILKNLNVAKASRYMTPRPAPKSPTDAARPRRRRAISPLTTSPPPNPAIRRHRIVGGICPHQPLLIPIWTRKPAATTTTSAPTHAIHLPPIWNSRDAPLVSAVGNGFRGGD